MKLTAEETADDPSVPILPYKVAESPQLLCSSQRARQGACFPEEHPQPHSPPTSTQGQPVLWYPNHIHPKGLPNGKGKG